MPFPLVSYCALPRLCLSPSLCCFAHIFSLTSSCNAIWHIHYTTMRATSNGVLPHCFLVRPRVSCAHLLGLGDLMEIKEWRHNTILHTLLIKGGGEVLNSIFPSPQNRIHKGGYESPIVPKGVTFVSTLCSKSLDIYDKQTPPSEVLSHCVGVQVCAHMT